jgi:glycosyltransferase involved in cell wall biosynthesis
VSSGGVILCLSNLDWGVLRYRKQHLMERMSTRMPVAYVNPPRAIKSRALFTATRWRQPMPGLSVFEPPVLPGIRRSPAMKALTYRLIARQLRQWLRRHRPRQPLVLWLYSPHALPFIDLIGPDLVVYDVADLYATASGAAIRDAAEQREIDLLAALEQRLLPRANLVLTVSEPLQERFSRDRGAASVHLVPNGCDWERYAQGLALLPRRARPLVGFVGTIAPRFDVELVADVARQRPEWDIELVGPVSPLTDVRALRALPNVQLAGEIHYDAVPERIASYDVCLLPLREIDFAYYSSPIQVYDYLAAGRPVVSTPIAQFEGLPHLVRTARGAAAFVDAIAASLDDGPRKTAERRTFAEANSWDVRVRTIEKLLAGACG